jgi:hypothetical protein
VLKFTSDRVDGADRDLHLARNQPRLVNLSIRCDWHLVHFQYELALIWQVLEGRDVTSDRFAIGINHGDGLGRCSAIVRPQQISCQHRAQTNDHDGSRRQREPLVGTQRGNP